jgi:Arc/MetJ-type ribon-helix-helix transcriptional regulator
MSVSLSPELQALIEERVKRSGYPTADDMVRVALDVLDQVEDERIDDEEAAAIRRSLEQMRRGEVVQWGQLSAQLRKKHLGE